MGEIHRDFALSIPERLSSPKQSAVLEGRRNQPPLSPTQFPGQEIGPGYKPMFPDMRRDEYMSKSTISTKDTARAGDYGSESSASDRGNYAPHRRSYGNRNREERDYDYSEYDPRRGRRRDEHAVNQSRETNVSRGRRRGTDHSLERRRESEPSLERGLDRTGNPDRDIRRGVANERGRIDSDFPPSDYEEFKGSHYQYKEEFHRPQHQYEDVDYAAPRAYRGHFGGSLSDHRGFLERDHVFPHPAEQFPPRSPRTVPTPRSDRGFDRRPSLANIGYDHHQRGRSRVRSDRDYYSTNYDPVYPQRETLGRSGSPDHDKWARTTDYDPQHDDWNDEVPQRRKRSKSRARSVSRERGESRRDDEGFDHERMGEYWRQRPASRGRISGGDDDSESSVQYGVARYRSRERLRKSRYEENDEVDDDDDDDNDDVASSESSLIAECGGSPYLQSPRYSRDRSRARRRSRSAENLRRNSKSRERREPQSEPSEFVIDISQPFTADVEPEDHGVTFSPSTDLPNQSSSVGSNATSEYSKRIADANLMKEQSEARHQILKEVRQAIDMRDMASDVEDILFWEKQVSALNASLKKLWDDHDPSAGIGRMHDHSQRERVRSTATPSVNNFTTVKVQAPDNLPVGHQFTVRVNGKPLKAKVPKGGVRKGDVFTIRVPLNVPPTTPNASQSHLVVKVRAPASLPEGYRFTAKMGEKTIVATVPPGGVKKGEIFSVPVSATI